MEDAQQPATRVPETGALQVGAERRSVDSRPLLEVKNLSVAFRSAGANTTVVNNISFHVSVGEALAIVGESGSGKTVSMRGILGLLPDTAAVSGEAIFDGENLITVPRRRLRHIRSARIGMVFQNPMAAFNPTLSLRRQLTEHLLWHEICGKDEAIERAIIALDRVGMPNPKKCMRMYPFQLSGGMLQRAMVAMAIVARPDLLIADEPTTAVDVTLQRQVLDLLRDLRSDGLALTMITHDLGVAKYSCDEVIVMRAGEIVESGEMASFAAQAREPYSKALLASALDIEPLGADADEQPCNPAATLSNSPDAPARQAPIDKDQQAQLLVARDVHKVFRTSDGAVHAVKGVNFEVSHGEIVGIVGESGSGKSTLVRLLSALLPPSSGSVVLDGQNLLTARASQLRKLRRSMQMVFQNPLGSLFPHLSILSNITEPLRVHGIGTRDAQKRRALRLLDDVGIPSARAGDYPRQFSGGQQQRIAIARALALEPRLLICDEPTSALDVTVQAQILELLTELHHRLGFSMIFVTHNLAVAQRMCDRVVVMAKGQVVESAPSEVLFTSPRHPYTRALLASVLPVRGDATRLPPRVTDIMGGVLQEVSVKHWVRLAQIEEDDDTSQLLSH